MSSFLYRLGHLCFRARVRVVLAWALIIAVLGGLTVAFGGKFNDEFRIPGASSQIALDKLKMSFPAAAQVTADLVVVLPSGQNINDKKYRDLIEQQIKSFKELDFVDDVINPWNTPVKGLVSEDHRAALVRLLLKPDATSITDAMRDKMTEMAAGLQQKLPGSEVKMGGNAYSVELPHISFTEAMGVGVAVIVLIITLGSVAAASFPLISALVGAGLAVMSIILAAGVVQINSTTLVLALMLSLAVGIDYSLFIISRHRDQLASGMAVEESAARAVGTSGSAVVFAGTTVVIALVGLFISQIPFLTVMGMFAAFAVTVEVALAITLLPAMMGFAGERLRPSEKPGLIARMIASGKASKWWMKVVTKHPIIIIVVVLTAVGALSLPVKNLQMALPNPGRHLQSSADRQTFDLISKEFGVGYNGVLVVTATIVESTDPLGIAKGMKQDIEKLPGVASVAISTPNQNADTLMVQVVPTTGPDNPETNKLVEAIRDQKQHWKDKYHIDVAVTGFTAVAIDVAARLAAALLPFALFVVGLSLVLLLLVFRSIWVPVKAALGYLLSIGGAFGATQLVFNEGYGKWLINLPETKPVIAFLPIIVMGILFGLAMDYEVFLVSRMREEFVHGNRENSVVDGFVHSSKVVVAAAVIMFAVFAFFVPSSQGPVKSIAFALAVGVAIDAFLVRMTLVPAVMTLLGERAWRISERLDQALPVMDIEGETLAHQLSLADWPHPDASHSVYAEGLTLGPRAGAAQFNNVDLSVHPGEVAIVRGPTAARRALIYAISGRLVFDAGQAKVAGYVLPEQRGLVLRQVTCISQPTEANLQAVMSNKTPVIALDWPPPTAEPEVWEAARKLVAERGETAVILACGLDTDLAAVLGLVDADTTDLIPTLEEVR